MNFPTKTFRGNKYSYTVMVSSSPAKGSFGRYGHAGVITHEHDYTPTRIDERPANVVRVRDFGRSNWGSTDRCELAGDYRTALEYAAELAADDCEAAGECTAPAQISACA